MSAIPAVRSASSLTYLAPVKQSSSLCQRIKKVWDAFWGFFLRVFVFHIAAANSPAARFVYGLLHFNCHKTVVHGAIDIPRVHKLEDQMRALGGIIGTTKTAKGHPVQYALLRFKDFKNSIEKTGGRLLLGDGVYYIRPPKKSNPAWQNLSMTLQSFCNESSIKIGWSKMPDGSFKLGRAADAKSGTCLLRCRGPGGVYEAKRFIAGYLGSGIDLCLFNWPGVMGSKGTPSEGANYSAAEAVFQMLKTKFAYDPQRVYASGFCLGAAAAVKLYKDHAQEGLNIILENAFTSMPDMVQHLTHFQCFGDLGRTELQEEGYSDQDGFDNVAKLKSIRGRATGSISIVRTENDHTVPPHSHTALVEQASRCSRRVNTLVWKNAGAKGHQAHSGEPLHYKENWRRHLEWFRA